MPFHVMNMSFSNLKVRLNFTSNYMTRAYIFLPYVKLISSWMREAFERCLLCIKQSAPSFYSMLPLWRILAVQLRWINKKKKGVVEVFASADVWCITHLPKAHNWCTARRPQQYFWIAAWFKSQCLWAMVVVAWARKSHSLQWHPDPFWYCSLLAS